MKDRPIILIPVMPDTVLAKLAPLVKIIEEREQKWREAALLHDKREFEPGRVYAATQWLGMSVSMFCDRVRRIKGLAELACGTFSLTDEDANFVAQADRCFTPMQFDFHAQRELGEGD